MQNFYPEENKWENTKFVLNKIKKIETSTTYYKENALLSSYSIGDLSNIISAADSISIAARAASSEVIQDVFDEIAPQIIPEIPCKIEVKNSAITIKTPLTLKRNGGKSSAVSKENYMLLAHVNAEISRFLASEGADFLKNFTKNQSGPWVFIIKREALKFNKNVFCDNDNLENGRVQNAICSMLGISDSCRIMDLYSCFRECSSSSEIGTSFTITALKNLPEYL